MTQEDRPLITQPGRRVERKAHMELPVNQPGSAYEENCGPFCRSTGDDPHPRERELTSSHETTEMRLSACRIGRTGTIPRGITFVSDELGMPAGQNKKGGLRPITDVHG